jgi:hypothetical protein
MDVPDMDVPDMNVENMVVPETDGIETAFIDEQDESLQPYLDWLEKIDFMSLWKEG